MYLGQAMGICPGLMNFQTFDTSGTPYSVEAFRKKMIVLVRGSTISIGTNHLGTNPNIYLTSQN